MNVVAGVALLGFAWVCRGAWSFGLARGSLLAALVVAGVVCFVQAVRTLRWYYRD